MDIQKLMDDIELDFNLTFENLTKKMYEVPNLHSKYLRIYLKQKSILHRLEKQASKKYRELFHHYTFDYEVRLSGSKEVEFHIVSDEAYADLNEKVKNQKILVDVLDRVLKKAQQLSFDVKNIMEHLKYINGV